MRINDGRCDRDGHLVFGTMSEGGQGARGPLRRREVAEGGGRAPREEVDVRESDDEEDEGGDGRREELSHRKIGSFRQPHFWSL